MTSTPLPKRISPCPITEAVTEIRFETALPAEVILGTLYEPIQNIFSKELEKLPASQLPEQLRKKDPSFQFTALYQFKKENFLLQLGPQVVLIANFNEYSGWNNFSTKIYSVLEIFKDKGIMKKVLRLGMRYLNFFENDMYENINLQIKQESISLDFKHKNFRGIIKNQNYITNFNIANEGTIPNKSTNGSLIDIDTSIETFDTDFYSNYKGIVEEAHTEEKKLFFGLLKPSFLKTLNPEY